MSDNKHTAAVLELLASRICHDIISPVGAINNGIELMQEMGADAMDDGLELVAYSANQSAAKLAAFRLAYGAGGKDPNIKPEDVQKIFGELIRAEGKISQTWDPYGNLGPKPLPLGYCKMLMCAMMLAMECLPKGGYISVRPAGDSASTIIAEGDGATVRAQVEEALEQKLDPEDLDPRLVHPYAISVLADSYGFKISIKSQAEGRIEFTMDCAEAMADNNSDESEESIGSAHG
ncbi:MAG TPA: histidine phosphotransferase family protein [Alphaproteobacteria bacterium]|nr:histidine phosphotransferase family protein [Alphaproteobacteria bacterium]